MRQVRRVATLTLSAAMAGIAVGCTGARAGTAADQLTTFAADFLRQLLAAFLF